MLVSVSVTYLPRLDKIPSQLLSSSVLDHKRMESATDRNTLKNSQSLPHTSSTVSLKKPKDLTHGEHEHSSPVAITSNVGTSMQQLPQSQAHQLFTSRNIATSSSLLVPATNLTPEVPGFPFSPPNPSPLSHKVLPRLLDDSPETENRSASETLSRPDQDMSSLCEIDRLSLSNGVTQLPGCVDSEISSKMDSGSELECFRGSSANGKCNSDNRSRMIISRLNSTTTPVPIKSAMPPACVRTDTNVVRPRGIRPPGASSPVSYFVSQTFFGA